MILIMNNKYSLPVKHDGEDISTRSRIRRLFELLLIDFHGVDVTARLRNTKHNSTL